MPRKTKLKSEPSLVKNEAEEQVSVNNTEFVVPASKEASTTPEKGVVDENNIFNPEGELVVDVFETNSEFVVLTAIAGVQIKDLDIAVEEDMIVIKGQRANPDDSPDRKYFHQECYWGPFSKKIILPENINTKAADAQINKGILTIKIPKVKEVKLS